jgi:dipeptidyl aminopeptidase/acylaminoacyl peptidase
MRTVRAGTLLAALGLLAAYPDAGGADTPPAPAPTPSLVASETSAPELPIASFAALPFFEGPQLSPDGTKVAVRLSIGGKQNFGIIPLADRSKYALISTGKVDLNNWRWVNNDWLLIRIGQTQLFEGEEFYFSRAHGVSADGKKFIRLEAPSMGQSGDDVLWVAHDGAPHALVAMQRSMYDSTEFWPEVRDFDVSTGHSRVVVASQPNVMDWYADGTGQVRYGVVYDDATRSYRGLYRDAGGTKFRVIESVRGAGTSLSNRPGVFLAEPGKALTMHDDDKGFTTVYPLDLTTMKRGAPIYSVADYDIDDMILDDARAQMIGVRYTDTYARTHWFDPTLAKVQDDLDKAVGTKRARIVSWSADRSVLLVHVSTASSPGSYYIYRVEEGTMHLLALANEALSRARLAPVRTVTYKARDGLEIPAILTLPAGRPAKNLPLIMMPHGGPYARDDESWDWQAQFLANRGYAVLQPNYRGSTGYGTKFLDKGKGQWGLGMQDDLIDAVNWAAKEGIADPKRVCIVGGSYGGYAALRGAQRDKGVYRCAVSYAGVADLNAMLRYDASFMSGGASKDYWRAQGTDLKAVSPINFAADFSMPVLLMHGADDRRVPVKQSRQMADRLKAAGKTYRYVEQPDGDHHFSREADRAQFLKELEAFLKQYNPA